MYQDWKSEARLQAAACLVELHLDNLEVAQLVSKKQGAGQNRASDG
jgi:hypothetical protein